MKPANVLQSISQRDTKPVYKVADFGVSIGQDPTEGKMEQAGTYRYMGMFLGGALIDAPDEIVISRALQRRRCS